MSAGRMGVEISAHEGVTMANGFKLNKPGINSMMKEIQREFDKHPIHIPVNADSPGLKIVGDTYNAPVINVQGDNTQIAWDNKNVNQTNSISTDNITPGYEPLSQAVVSILKEIRSSGLDAQEIEEVERSGHEILAEVIKEQPDQGVIKRAATYMKGLLAPLVTRSAESAAEGLGDGVYDWASTGIEALGAGMAAAFQG